MLAALKNLYNHFFDDEINNSTGSIKQKLINEISKFEKNSKVQAEELIKALF